MLAVGLAACGEDERARQPPAAGAAPAKTAAAPSTTTTAPAAKPQSALERNAADANTLAGEGADDLEERLAALKGHPIVVNQWASWCGPCRFEFPFFASAVGRHGAKVAFVGIDFMDSRDSAEEFLGEQPPGFASVYDGDGKAARAVTGSQVMPTTLFIGPDGRTRFKKLGGYADAAALEADIRRYALGAS